MQCYSLTQRQSRNESCFLGYWAWFSEKDAMNLMHYLLPEDEILLCGALLLYGILFGGVARLIVLWWNRRTA